MSEIAYLHGITQLVYCLIHTVVQYISPSACFTLAACVAHPAWWAVPIGSRASFCLWPRAVMFTIFVCSLKHMTHFLSELYYICSIYKQKYKAKQKVLRHLPYRIGMVKLCFSIWWTSFSNRHIASTDFITVFWQVIDKVVLYNNFPDLLTEGKKSHTMTMEQSSICYSSSLCILWTIVALVLCRCTVCITDVILCSLAPSSNLPLHRNIALWTERTSQSTEKLRLQVNGLARS